LNSPGLSNSRCSNPTAPLRKFRDINEVHKAYGLAGTVAQSCFAIKLDTDSLTGSRPVEFTVLKIAKKWGESKTLPDDEGALPLGDGAPVQR
jgi:hypothetical protein